MKISDHFDHPERKQNKARFNHLIEVAMADGIIQDSEKQILHRLGRKMGLTEPEIDNLIETAKKSEFIPPYEFSKRFEQLHDIIKMVLADGIIDNSEMRLAKGLAVIYGFDDKEIPDLLEFLINGINNKEDEEELFRIYRKKRMINQ